MEVQGWFVGETDCDPPEPGKRWLSVVDGDGEEICVLVQRKRPPEGGGAPEYREDDVRRREGMARRIVEALDA